MKQISYGYFLAVILFLSGCSMFAVPPIDTFNKQVLAFEVSYGVLLNKGNLYKKEGRFSPSILVQMQDYVKNINLALESVYTYRHIGDITNAENQLKAATAALELLRAEIIAAEGL